MAQARHGHTDCSNRAKLHFVRGRSGPLLLHLLGMIWCFAGDFSCGARGRCISGLYWSCYRKPGREHLSNALWCVVG